MLEVRVLVSDIDYDGIVDMALPLVADKLTAKGGLLAKFAGQKDRLGNIAHKFIAKRGQDGMEKLIADLATKKRSLIIEKAAAAAAKKGIGVQIVGIDVKKI